MNQTKSGSSLCKHRKSKQVFCNTVQALYHLVPTKTSKNAFYLQPLRNPTPHCWYAQEPLGHNKLADTVSRLWKSAGIKGVKTNHSLRVTNATCHYSSGTDKQLIMERTGHQSTDGVRPYKHTSEEQQIAISDILNRSKKQGLNSNN